MSHIIIGLALALAAVGATPADVPQTAQPAAVEATADATAATPAAKPKKICTKERPMGSNMPKRVCRDADAAADQANLTRDVMRDAQRNRYSTPTGADL